MDHKDLETEKDRIEEKIGEVEIVKVGVKIAGAVEVVEVVGTVEVEVEVVVVVVAEAAVVVVVEVVGTVDGEVEVVVVVVAEAAVVVVVVVREVE